MSAWLPADGPGTSLRTAPRRVIDGMRDVLGLQVFSPPLELEMLPIWMLWHERGQLDPAQLWLRAMVVRAWSTTA